MAMGLHQTVPSVRKAEPLTKQSVAGHYYQITGNHLTPLHNQLYQPHQPFTPHQSPLHFPSCGENPPHPDFPGFKTIPPTPQPHNSTTPQLHKRLKNASYPTPGSHVSKGMKIGEEKQNGENWGNWMTPLHSECIPSRASVLFLHHTPPTPSVDDARAHGD